MLKKLGLKKKVRKVLRSPKLLFIAATVLVLGATLLFANKGIWRHVSLRRDVSALTNRDSILDKEEARLKYRVSMLTNEDPTMMERIAREKYHMRRGGETVYREEKAQ